MKRSTKQKGNTQGKSKVQKGKGKEPLPSDWATKEKESKIPNLKPKKGQKGKGYTVEEASVPESDAPDQCCMTPGKQTVPFGTGIPKMTGKRPTQTTKTGRRLRNGSNRQAGLPENYLEALPLNQKEN
jgi:hypothetical protein